MFALFYSLYMAMFTGAWTNYTWQYIYPQLQNAINGVGTFLTSIFGDNTYTTLGDTLFTQYQHHGILCIVAFVLALITSIGIVVVATKGIKKLFTVFFYGVR